MLASFTLQNFKSYRQATLPLAPLTLLVGANASGKSNALEGLRLLRALARGIWLNEIPAQLQHGKLGVRGLLADLSYQQTQNFTLVCNSDVQQIALTFKNDKGGLSIERETLTNTETNEILYTAEPEQLTAPENTRLRVSYLIGHPTTASAQQPIFIAEHYPLRKMLGEQVVFLGAVVDQMRGYSENVDAHQYPLQENANNISGVLYRLCQSVEMRQKVLEFARALPEQDIAEIDFLHGPRGEVMLQLNETFGGQRHKRDAALLSDGTLQVLAIAAVLLYTPPETVIVIEEIDNGIHPSRAKHLLETIYKVAQERNLRVLLTTHNPALANALPIKAIPDAVVCYRDPEQGDSRLARLGDLDEYSALVGQGALGDLMVSGILERFMKQPKLTPEERAARNRAWLERLRADLEA